MKITRELYKSSIPALLSLKSRRVGWSSFQTGYLWHTMIQDIFSDNKPKVLIEKDFRLNKYNYIIK